MCLTYRKSEPFDCLTCRRFRTLYIKGQCHLVTSHIEGVLHKLSMKPITFIQEILLR